ncbi:hypothetical protein [Tissierella sp. Yu-01]|uniref:hypothetical protein n=1 Tax=Tissierella sp. Yu-01 TaxID=3035694 RepID=UPI00240D9D45|nr:hypothetical protein [Tissierella sp. Yu-01]WFA07720.1 hypothetical protein P3962_08240 [Tissierella sp. Yu-01]
MFDFLKKLVSNSDEKEVQSKLNSASNNSDEELAVVIAAAISAYSDEELIAVIAAAVSASMGVGVPDINIKSIKRVPQSSTPWTRMGKIEQLLGKL